MAKAKMQKLRAFKMGEQAIQRVREIIELYGPRYVGQESTKKAARHLHEAFVPYCDRVEKESFSLHPEAFLAWIRIMVALYPIALIFMFLSQPLFSFLFLTIGVVIMVREFLLYHEMIDPLFAKKEGINIYGVIEPKGEVKHTVVYSGHHDSAKVFTFFLDSQSSYVVKVFLALGSYLFLTLLSFIDTIRQIVVGTLFSFSLTHIAILIPLILATIATYFVRALWFFASNEVSPGAGDNLIASTIGVELASYFKNEKSEGNALEHTRLIFASFDGEEAGLRGSRNFFTTHKDSGLLSENTYNFNVDCLFDHEHMNFLTSDINNSVQLSQSMATECVEIATSMGYVAHSKKIAFLTGGTDAAEAAKVGFTATTLLAMPWSNNGRSSVYHTPLDTVEAIDEKAVEQTISIAIKFIEHLDKK
ncbi:MAG: M28 family peptidase [Spirochaetia bacterium]|nr:M28 family peptidase [Spirochaetia bacterium]